MKILKTLFFHAIIWSAIYWGALVGYDPVANLSAVIMTLLGIFMIIVSLIAHYIFADNPEKFANQIVQESNNGIVGWLFRISSYSQAFSLIIVGWAWIALGTLWLIAVILLDSLVMRAKKVDTEPA